MAKKKRKPHGDGRERRKRPPREIPDIADAILMEEIMRKLCWKLMLGEENTSLAKAYRILLRAYHEPDDNRRVRLAKRALDVCPDCADAYFLLAQESHGRKEALRLYEQGVAAGARALGPETFERHVGRFWRILEARPYMRARLQQAASLWRLGRREEAVQHLQDMLRLNPEDNQQVRYMLASFLFFLDRDNDLVQLLRQYPEERSAAWAYTKALLSFRKSGDTITARRLLRQALKTNKHVPRYLVGEKDPPAEEISGQYSPGTDCEALNYIDDFMGAWRSTAGAVAWLRDNIYKKKKAAEPKGPLAFVKNQLTNKLRQEYDVWQAHFGRVPNWAGTGAKRQRPWVTLVTSPSAELVLAHEVHEEPPSAALLWDTLAQAMQHPTAGEAHRPSELHVHHDERWESLKAHLDEIGVELVAEGELDFVDKAFKDLTDHVWGKPRPGLLDMPGVTLQQVGRCYAAAAAFFRRAPWKMMGSHAAIKVECGKFQSGPWYAMLGQSSLVALTLYHDLHTLQRIWSGRQDTLKGMWRMASTEVIFQEEPDCPSAEVDACKKHGWDVARPDAYPVIIRKERGMSMRPALAWELELMEGCLRAVPDFMERHKGNEPGHEEMTVPVASGQLRMALSWVDDE